MYALSYITFFFFNVFYLNYVLANRDYTHCIIISLRNYYHVMTCFISFFFPLLLTQSNFFIALDLFVLKFHRVHNKQISFQFFSYFVCIFFPAFLGFILIFKKLNLWTSIERADADVDAESLLDQHIKNLVQLSFYSINLIFQFFTARAGDWWSRCWSRCGRLEPCICRYDNAWWTCWWSFPLKHTSSGASYRETKQYPV